MSRLCHPQVTGEAEAGKNELTSHHWGAPGVGSLDARSRSPAPGRPHTASWSGSCAPAFPICCAPYPKFTEKRQGPPAVAFRGLMWCLQQAMFRVITRLLVPPSGYSSGALLPLGVRCGHVASFGPSHGSRSHGCHQAWWYTPVILALGTPRPEDHKYDPSVSCQVSSRPA